MYKLNIEKRNDFKDMLWLQGAERNTPSTGLAGVRNFIYTDKGRLRLRGGFSKLNTVALPGPITGMKQVPWDVSSNKFVCASLTSIYSWNVQNSAFDPIYTLQTSGKPTSFAADGGILLFCNGTDPMMYYNGSICQEVIKPLEGWYADQQPSFVIIHKNRAWCVVGPMVYASDLQVPYDFQNGTATQFPTGNSDPVATLIDALDRLFVIKDKSIGYIYQPASEYSLYMGAVSSDAWVFRMAYSSVTGTSSPFGACGFGEMFYYGSPDGLFEVAASGRETIGNLNTNRIELLGIAPMFSPGCSEHLNFNSFENLLVVPHFRRNEVWFFVGSTSTTLDTILVYSRALKRWTIFSMPNCSSACSYITNAYRRIVAIGTTNGYVGLSDQTFDGLDLGVDFVGNSYLDFVWSGQDQGELFKQWRMLTPVIQGKRFRYSTTFDGGRAGKTNAPVIIASTADAVAHEIPLELDGRGCYCKTRISGTAGYWPLEVEAILAGSKVVRQRRLTTITAVGSWSTGAPTDFTKKFFPIATWARSSQMNWTYANNADVELQGVAYGNEFQVESNEVRISWPEVGAGYIRLIRGVYLKTETFQWDGYWADPSNLEAVNYYTLGGGSFVNDEGIFITTITLGTGLADGTLVGVRYIYARPSTKVIPYQGVNNYPCIREAFRSGSDFTYDWATDMLLELLGLFWMTKGNLPVDALLYEAAIKFLWSQYKNTHEAEPGFPLLDKFDWVDSAGRKFVMFQGVNAESAAAITTATGALPVFGPNRNGLTVDMQMAQDSGEAWVGYGLGWPKQAIEDVEGFVCKFSGALGASIKLDLNASLPDAPSYSGVTWTLTTAMTVGQFGFPTYGKGTGYVYEWIDGTITGATEPTWPTTIGGTVVDGDGHWRCKALYNPIEFIYSAGIVGIDPATMKSLLIPFDQFWRRDTVVWDGVRYLGKPTGYSTWTIVGNMFFTYKSEEIEDPVGDHHQACTEITWTTAYRAYVTGLAISFGVPSEALTSGNYDGIGALLWGSLYESSPCSVTVKVMGSDSIERTATISLNVHESWKYYGVAWGSFSGAIVHPVTNVIFEFHATYPNSIKVTDVGWCDSVLAPVRHRFSDLTSAFIRTFQFSHKYMSPAIAWPSWQTLADVLFYITDIGFRLLEPDAYPLAPNFAVSISQLGQSNWRGPSLLHYNRPFSAYVANALDSEGEYDANISLASQKLMVLDSVARYKLLNNIDGPIIPCQSRNYPENVSILEGLNNFEWWRKWRTYGREFGVWNFNNSLIDASGNGRTLSWVGGGSPSYIAGICLPSGNTTIAFDGTHYASLASVADFVPNSEGFSLTLIIKGAVQAGNYAIIAQKIDGSNGWAIQTKLAADDDIQLKIKTSVSTYYADITNVLNGSWHVLQWTINPRTGKIRAIKDGVFFAEYDWLVGTGLVNIDPLRIGYSAIVNIDLFKYDGRVLDDDECIDFNSMILGTSNCSTYPEIGAHFPQYTTFRNIAMYRWLSGDTTVDTYLTNFLAWIVAYAVVDGPGYKWPHMFHPYGFSQGPSFDPSTHGLLLQGLVYHYWVTGSATAATWITRIMDDLRLNRVDGGINTYKTDFAYSWLFAHTMSGFGLAIYERPGATIAHSVSVSANNIAWWASMLVWLMAHKAATKPAQLSLDLIPYTYYEDADSFASAPNYMFDRNMGSTEALVLMANIAFDYAQQTGNYSWLMTLLNFLVKVTL